MSAAAAPCTALATINAAVDGASAHACEARVKAAMPARKIRRRPTMSPSRPPVISKMAKGSVQAALNH